MRIPCAYCGPRDSSEFLFLRNANYRLTDLKEPDALKSTVEMVYLRENPAGRHEELWYHQHGCRSWLRVTRDTRTHEVNAVDFYAGTDGTSVCENK